jgi:hypothetical protein
VLAGDGGSTRPGLSQSSVGGNTRAPGSLTGAAADPDPEDAGAAGPGHGTGPSAVGGVNSPARLGSSSANAAWPAPAAAPAPGWEIWVGGCWELSRNRPDEPETIVDPGPGWDSGRAACWPRRPSAARSAAAKARQFG